jgi:hypothetical protein
MRKLIVLLVLAGAVLAIAPSSSAAIGPAQDAATRATDAASCAPPCFVYYYKKGSGTGIVSSTPAGMACTSDCRGQFGDGDVSLTALPTNGSVFRRWENCDIPQGTTCFIPPAPEVHICAVFDTPTSTAPMTPCPPYQLGTPPPPAPPASPPPPPPSGPPPLGSRCTIPGTSRANVMNGTAGRDVICGRGGNDTINGRGGHDLILGGTGADRLTGGLGRDAIYGGSGNDTLFARDGVRDTVNGGLGRDRARWDARDVRRSIERRF